MMTKRFLCVAAFSFAALVVFIRIDSNAMNNVSNDRSSHGKLHSSTLMSGSHLKANVNLPAFLTTKPNVSSNLDIASLVVSDYSFEASFDQITAEANNFPVVENIASNTETLDNILYSSNFDVVMDEWQFDGNIWHMGSPVYGPHDLCGNSSTCLGTIMDGEYPDHIDATLTSPKLFLPLLSTNESIYLRFSNWFDIDANDLIKISAATQYGDGTWSNPETLSIQSGKQTEWQDYEVDLSRFEGEHIKLNFDLIQENGEPGTGAGWMLNNIQIIQTEGDNNGKT